MAGGRQHLHAEPPALGVGPAVDLLDQDAEGPDHDLIGVVVVVAVLVRLVDQLLAKQLVAGEVAVQRLDERGERQLPVSKTSCFTAARLSVRLPMPTNWM